MPIHIVKLVITLRRYRPPRPARVQGFRNRASATAAPNTDRIVAAPVTTIHSFARSMSVRSDSMDALTDPNSPATDPNSFATVPNSFATSVLNDKNSPLNRSKAFRNDLTSPLTSVMSACRCCTSDSNFPNLPSLSWLSPAWHAHSSKTTSHETDCCDAVQSRQHRVRPGLPDRWNIGEFPAILHTWAGKRHPQWSGGTRQLPINIVLSNTDDTCIPALRNVRYDTAVSARGSPTRGARGVGGER